jgi:hypothetical protein
MVRRNWLAAVVMMLTAAGVGVAAEETVGSRAGGMGDKGASAPNRAEVEALVRSEVARELPKLLEGEVRKQLGEAIARAGKTARIQSAASTLVTLRSQLELYRIMHNDAAPALEALKDWRALRVATDATGAFVAGANLGPYIQESPVNPFTGRSAVVAAGTATTAAGWTWDEKKMKLRIVLPEGEAEALRAFTLENAEVVKVRAAAVRPDAVMQMRQQGEALAK